MHRKDAIAGGVWVCSVSLRLSQAKTLSILVAAAMRVQRASLANIGRMMDGGEGKAFLSVKHQIKRCWRFCANDRLRRPTPCGRSSPLDADRLGQHHQSRL